MNSTIGNPGVDIPIAEKSKVIFECAETIVQKYADYLTDTQDQHLSPPELKRSDAYVRPLLFDMGNNKQLAIFLDIVPVDSYESSIIQYAKDEIIVQGFSFLIYCARAVFTSISGVESKLNKMGLIFDDKKEVLYATYASEDLLKKDHLEKLLNKLLNDKISSKCDSNWNSNWAITSKELELLNEKIEFDSKSSTIKRDYAIGFRVEIN